MLHCNQNCFQIQSHFTLYILCTQRNPIDTLCTRLVGFSQIFLFCLPCLSSNCPSLNVVWICPWMFSEIFHNLLTILFMFPYILVLCYNLNKIVKNVLLYKCSVRLLSMHTLNRTFMLQNFCTYFNNLSVLLEYIELCYSTLYVLESKDHFMPTYYELYYAYS